MIVGTVIRSFGKPLFEIVKFRLAFSQSEPPSIILGIAMLKTGDSQSGRKEIEAGLSAIWA